MAMKWMMGTAAVALLAATPAFAQTAPASGDCALNGMTEERFQTLDADGNGELSMDEYRACLIEANVEEADRAEFETAFGEADADANMILVFADIERMGDIAAADVGDDGRPQGTITVTQPAADVTVRQPSPDVTVTQGEPTVNVEARAPEVAVETPAPEVNVTQPEPEVAVTQPEPEVSVTQPEPVVAINQPEPEVSVQPGQPAVEVETAEPEVAVATPEPVVAVEQPELDVNVEQAQPDVMVEQAQPDVAVRRSGSADVSTETAAAATGTETDVTADTAAAAPIYRIAMDDIVGQDVYNSAGEEIGEVRDIVIDPARQVPMVIVEVGGFLGIGGRQVALSYDDMAFGGDRIVLNTAMSQDEIKDMPEYDEAAYSDLPETMIVR
jgi:sporulation protein YlmC with PRC-barrel domain